MPFGLCRNFLIGAVQSDFIDHVIQVFLYCDVGSITVIENMFTLHPNRSLLNPKFDGYKLDPISSEDTVARHALEHIATQASVPGRHHLSFQETESRIRHNHLTVSPDGEQAVYIDKDLRVISVRLDHVRVLHVTVQSPFTRLRRTHSNHPSQRYMTFLSLYKHRGLIRLQGNIRPLFFLTPRL